MIASAGAESSQRLRMSSRSALAAISAARLAEERADAMDYYLGDMSRDMPAQDGRSRAVSTDVADTIEGLMPPLMDIFAGSDEVVRFEPVGPEDEAAAQQETDYVNHVFMQQNPGFMVLYSFIKDALLSKIGIVKVWWEECEDEIRETYPSLSLATVYNTLDVLVKAGAVYTLGEAGDNTLHYDADTEPHVNLACLRCHRVIDFPSEHIVQVESEVQQTSGYRLLGARVMYYGLCPECQAESERTH